jgi:poly(3-hydroxybutyrate) depolymerase
MAKPQRFLVLIPLCLTALAACEGGVSGGGTAGHGQAGHGGGAGASGSAGATGNAGANGSSAGASGSSAGANGAAGSIGSAGASGAAGATGAAGAGTAGATGAAGAGAAGSSGVAGSSGAAGMGVVSKPHGPSSGCNKPPATGDKESDYVLKEVHITAALDPVYLKGGKIYTDKKLPISGYDFQFRPYGLKLPKSYSADTPYAVTFGGGGCGGDAGGFARGPGGGLQIEEKGGTLQVGLSYLGGCFDDGGGAIDARSDTPEEPYFRAVLADIEAKYCVDTSRVFVSGYSSGGWEAYTLGCAAADVIRGVSGDEGGMRIHRPACKGPVAALFVAGESDTTNPIGPLAKVNTDLDSFGSAPGRDDILKRNGCVSADYVFTYADTKGSAPHTAWDPAYSACVQYTGCPAEYPVVWCPLPNQGHNSSTYNNVQYSPGGMWKLLGALPSRP